MVFHFHGVDDQEAMEGLIMKLKGVCISISFFLLASAFVGVAFAEKEPPQDNDLNLLERWNIYQEEASKLKEVSNTLGNDGSRGFSYFDGPYPNTQDSGVLGDFPPDDRHPLDIDHFVSEIFGSFPNSVPAPFMASAMGGDMLVGDVHECWIGDQDGNGILEWLVFFYYLPWTNDGLDNDGDGCVDEKRSGNWDGQVGCDRIPDAVVIYETGGSPVLGGEKADLLVNLDWYSGAEKVEIFRAFASIPWNAYQMRNVVYNPQIAGEFISYNALERINDINANPEMDNDQWDFYVGNIDARRFPDRPPVDHACSSGYMLNSGATYLRDDDWVVTSFELRESYDDHDWNDDGDNEDFVSAYYAVDPSNGNCRLNVVNTGVQGVQPRNTGLLLTPRYTYESSDSRDWDQDSTSGFVQLYHDVNSTWNMKGKAYTSYTFTAPVPTWGFGWWALFNDGDTYEPHPLKFGGSYMKYVGYSNGYYHTYFFITSDEDGDRHTKLPGYHVTYGIPAGALAGRCAVIKAYEAYLRYAGVRLMPSPSPLGDANGDGDSSDVLGLIYCPDKSGGGGNFVIEHTSKFVKGLYADPIPYIWLGHILDLGTHEFNGYASVVFYRSKYELHDDCDEGGFNSIICSNFYTISVPPLGDTGQGNMAKGDTGSGPEGLQGLEVLRQSQPSSQEFSDSTESVSSLIYGPELSRWHQTISSKIAEGSERR